MTIAYFHTGTPHIRDMITGLYRQEPHRGCKNVRLEVNGKSPSAISVPPFRTSNSTFRDTDHGGIDNGGEGGFHTIRRQPAGAELGTGRVDQLTQRAE